MYAPINTSFVDQSGHNISSFMSEYYIALGWQAPIWLQVYNSHHKPVQMLVYLLYTNSPVHQWQCLGESPISLLFLHLVCLYSLLYTLVCSVLNAWLSVMYKFSCESMTMSWGMSYLHLDTSHLQSRLLDKLTRCNEPSCISCQWIIIWLIV